MEATTIGLGRRGLAPALVPAAGFALAAATIAYGFVARAEGTRLGASLAPFLWDWRPTLQASALPAAVLLALGVWLAPRLRAPAVRPWVFALSALTLGLALRMALGSARAGVDGLWAVYQVGNHEAANEYLPALPALDFGAVFFLDTFAEVGTSLPVHAIGHPPGLLLMLHWLGIDGAPGMATLTIGAGALAIPLTYLLARELLDEDHRVQQHRQRATRRPAQGTRVPGRKHVDLLGAELDRVRDRRVVRDSPLDQPSSFDRDRSEHARDR